MPNAARLLPTRVTTTAKRHPTNKTKPKPDNVKKSADAVKKRKPPQDTVVDPRGSLVRLLSPSHTNQNTEPTDNTAPCRKRKQPGEPPPAHQPAKITRSTQHTPTGANGREPGPARHQLKKDGAPLTRKSKQAGEKLTANQPAKAPNKRKRDGTNEDDTRSTDVGGFFGRVIDFFTGALYKKPRLDASVNKVGPSLGVGRVFSIEPDEYEVKGISSKPNSPVFNWHLGDVFFGDKKPEGSSETSSEFSDDGSSSDGGFDSGFLTRELPKPPSEPETTQSSNGSRGSRVTNIDVIALFDKMKGQLAEHAIKSVLAESKANGYLNVKDYKKETEKFKAFVENAKTRKQIEGEINRLEDEIKKRSNKIKGINGKISDLKNPTTSEDENRRRFLEVQLENLFRALLTSGSRPVEPDIPRGYTSEEREHALHKKLGKGKAAKQNVSKRQSSLCIQQQLLRDFLKRMEEVFEEQRKFGVRVFIQATKKAGKKYLAPNKKLVPRK